MENFEAKVETTIVKVPKEVFGLSEQQYFSSKENHLELSGGDLENRPLHFEKKCTFIKMSPRIIQTNISGWLTLCNCGFKLLHNWDPYIKAN